MSRLAARFGVTFMCASASSRPRGWPGRSRKYACDRRRSVRNPESGAATGASRSSLDRLPRISAATSPARASSAARRPAACGSSAVSTIGRRAMSRPALSAVSRMRASGPDQRGVEVAGERARERDLQRFAVAGEDDGGDERAREAAPARRASGSADAWPWRQRGKRHGGCQRGADRWRLAAGTRRAACCCGAAGRVGPARRQSVCSVRRTMSTMASTCAGSAISGGATITQSPVALRCRPLSKSRFCSS